MFQKPGFFEKPGFLFFVPVVKQMGIERLELIYVFKTANKKKRYFSQIILNYYKARYCKIQIHWQNKKSVFWGILGKFHDKYHSTNA